MFVASLPLAVLLAAFLAHGGAALARLVRDGYPVLSMPAQSCVDRGVHVPALLNKVSEMAD
jgi:hypothetical protein